MEAPWGRKERGNLDDRNRKSIQREKDAESSWSYLRV